MEHGTPEPLESVPDTSMSTSENAPVAYYGDNSNGATAGLLSALALTKDNGYDGIGMIGAYNSGSLRHDVGELKGVIKDVECNLAHHVSDLRSDVVREGQEGVTATKDAESRLTGRFSDVQVKLGEVECNINKATSDQTLYLTNSLSVIREQGIRNEFEAKLAAERVIKEVNEKVDKESERTNDKVQESRNFNAERFCHVENLIKDLRTKTLEDKVLQQSQDIQTEKLARLICCGCGESNGPGNSGK